MHSNTNDVDSRASDDRVFRNPMKEMLITIPIVLFVWAVVFMIFRALLELPWVFT